MPETWAAVVVESEVDQDAHSVVIFRARTAFDTVQRALDYAEMSRADDATVYDPQGRIIYPEEACL